MIALTVAQRKEQTIKGKFGSLVSTTFTKLQAKLITGENVCIHLVAFYGKNKHFDASKFLRKFINPGLSLKEVFDAICKQGLWDFMDYELLQSIIEQFLSEDTQASDMLTQYHKNIRSYLFATKLEEYIKNAQSAKQSDLLPPASPDKNLFTALSIKVKGVNITQQSLEYISQLWKSLANQLSLPLQMHSLLMAEKGCLVITWLIPSFVESHVRKRVGESSNYFEEEHIISVVLDQNCIYPIVFEESPSQEAVIKEVYLPNYLTKMSIFSLSRSTNNFVLPLLSIFSGLKSND